MKKETAENEILLETAFDLTADGRFCRGRLTFDGETLCACDGMGGECLRRPDGARLVELMDIGCGRLELSPLGEDGEPLPQSENVSICRFSMSEAESIAAFCRAVNDFLVSGRLPQSSTFKGRRCEKCGRGFVTGIDRCLFCVDNGFVFRRSLEYVKPYTKQIILSAVLLTFSSVMSALTPVINRLMTDNYLSPADGVAPVLDAASGIRLLAFLMFATYAVGQVFRIFSQRLSNRFGSRLSDDMRRTVYDKIQKLSVDSMSGKTSGDLIKRVTRDTETVRSFIAEQGRRLIEQLVMFTVITVVLLFTNPLLTLLVFLPVPLTIWFFKLFDGFMHVRYGKQWRCASHANSILHDIIKGIRVVKTFGNEQLEIGKFSAASRALAEISVSNERLWAVIFTSIEFFVGIGEFFVLYFGGRMVLQGTMTLGELIQFTLFLAYIYGPLRWMSSLPKRLAEAGTSLVKLFEIIDEEQSVRDPDLPADVRVEGSIAFRDVSFGYKSYEPVLREVSFEVKPGEMVGLVGHSGAGKSTVINLLLRLYDPDSGSVCIDGEDLRSFEQRSLRENIGVVFQETYLFHGSVFDNIAYARSDADARDVIRAAKAADAHGFIMKLPEGYNTLIGENGHRLSGGERQRIAIARAVLKDPKILILDEATSSLDPETEDAVQRALGELVKNRTTVAIAHRLSTLRHADRLIVVEHGKIAETGTHRELLEQKGIYYNLIMAQRRTSKLHN